MFAHLLYVCSLLSVFEPALHYVDYLSGFRLTFVASFPSLPSGQSIVLDIETRLGSHTWETGSFLTSALLSQENRAYSSAAFDGETGQNTPFVAMYWLPKAIFGRFRECLSSSSSAQHLIYSTPRSNTAFGTFDILLLCTLCTTPVLETLLCSMSRLSQSHTRLLIYSVANISAHSSPAFIIPYTLTVTPLPIVASIYPPFGNSNGGERVTITGQNFGACATDVLSVTINGNPCTQVRFSVGYQ